MELAITLPVLLLMVTGIASFGAYLQQDIELTDAVNTGAKVLAIARGNTTDPCNLVYSTVTSAAPLLNSSNMSFTFTFNGNSTSATSCSSASTTTGYAGDLVQGKPVTVTAQYPCTLAVYGANLAPGCTITASLTEIVQ